MSRMLTLKVQQNCSYFYNILSVINVSCVRILQFSCSVSMSVGPLDNKHWVGMFLLSSMNHTSLSTVTCDNFSIRKCMLFRWGTDLEGIQVTCRIFTNSSCIDKSSKISIWWWISHIFLSRYDKINYISDQMILRT